MEVKMSNWDKDYLNLCRRILKEGKELKIEQELIL